MPPIPSSLRPALTAYTVGLARDAFLWPGGWRQDAGGR